MFELAKWIEIGLYGLLRCRRGRTKVRFVAFVALIKHFKAKLRNFSPVLSSSLRWKVDKTHRCRDLAIF